MDFALKDTQNVFSFFYEILGVLVLTYMTTLFLLGNNNGGGSTSRANEKKEERMKKQRLKEQEKVQSCDKRCQHCRQDCIDPNMLVPTVTAEVIYPVGVLNDTNHHVGQHHHQHFHHHPTNPCYSALNNLQNMNHQQQQQQPMMQ
mmetsp:Transcript_17460/g.26025  ORF Transcript_17460/g.26025 Transcript_17460/m.26025 type:complete len:145 (+) Transcript_17460:2-436(+)